LELIWLYSKVLEGGGGDGSTRLANIGASEALTVTRPYWLSHSV